MKFCLTALILMLALMAGCAAELRHTDARQSTLGKEIREPDSRGALISDCRMPCNVSPGPECC